MCGKFIYRSIQLLATEQLITSVQLDWLAGFKKLSKEQIGLGLDKLEYLSTACSLIPICVSPSTAFC